MSTHALPCARFVPVSTTFTSISRPFVPERYLCGDRATFVTAVIPALVSAAQPSLFTSKS